MPFGDQTLIAIGHLLEYTYKTSKVWKRSNNFDMRFNIFNLMTWQYQL